MATIEPKSTQPERRGPVVKRPSNESTFTRNLRYEIASEEGRGIVISWGIALTLGIVWTLLVLFAEVVASGVRVRAGEPVSGAKPVVEPVAVTFRSRLVTGPAGTVLVPVVTAGPLLSRCATRTRALVRTAPAGAVYGSFTTTEPVDTPFLSERTASAVTAFLTLMFTGVEKAASLPVAFVPVPSVNTVVVVETGPDPVVAPKMAIGGRLTS